MNGQVVRIQIISFFLLLVLFALLSSFQSRGADSLISTGAVWKFLDTGTNQSNAWRTLTFDDSSWTNSGPAQLGFGDGDEATITASNRQATTYFRRSFNVPDASIYSNLLVRLLRDDGGVVYLNGTEVFRSNMPTGAVTYATLAPASAAAADETTNFYLKYIDPALLTNGNNVVAVEIHQNSLTSTDLSFDFALIGNPVIRPPLVAITNIATSSFFKAGTNITVAAAASDPDDGVAKVEFYQGTNKLGEDLSAPYSLTWSNVAAGTYALTAVAFDLGSIMATSSPVTIFVVTNVPAVVTIASPTNGASVRAGTNVTIAVSATDVDNALVKVEFYSNNDKLGEDTVAPFSLVWSNVVLGEYALKAVATDDGGISSTSSIVNVVVVSNLPPTISLLRPTNNAVLGGPADIIITATNVIDPDGTVVLVEFFQNDQKIGEDPASPFTITWSNAPLGNYVLTATARDNGGLSRTSAPVSVIVSNNLAPTVSLTAPTNNAIFKLTNVAVFAVTAAAIDNDGAIVKVDFYQDNQKIAEDRTSPFSTNLTLTTAGSYVLTAVALDNAGASVTSAPVNVLIVTNYRPSVTITSPTNNASYGGPLDVTINATASDRDGTVAVVEFYQGENKIGEDAVTPYSIIWSNVALGAYSLTAIVRDSVGLTSTSSPVAITVNSNILPNVLVSAPTEGSVLRVPSGITLIATATDPDSGIRRVEFFANDQRLGEKTNSPYTIVWSNAVEGAYALTAVATDVVGGSRTSAPVNILLVTNFAPTVTMSAPTNNASFGGPVDVVIVANASDSDGTIALVEFFEGLNKIGEATLAPFQIVWPSVAISNYVLTAIATDNSGVSRTSAPINLNIRTNALPTVSITNPRTNSVFNILSNVVITANAADSDGGVRRVEFYANATRLGQVTNSPYTLTWSNIVTGIQVLSAVATDVAGGSRTSAPVRISVLSNIPPVIAITNPVNNTILSLKTPLTIQVRATDVDGTIAKVELFQSEFKIGELTAPPFNFPMSNLYAGSYTFRARATDSYGESIFSDAVSVTLHNRHLLVPQGSVWRYLDTGVDQSNSWRGLAFDDSSWTNGRAQLGFGDGDEVSVVNGGPTSNRFATIYFRYTFVVTNRDSFSNVVIRLLRDDGGVVYLNGNEAFRSNISTNATNEIVYSTLAPAGALAEDETTAFYQTTVSVTNLMEGTNVVGVEIHQNSLTSSDLSFDLELSATDAIGISRGPYLQSGTPTSVIVRWRTDGPTESRVHYGTALGALHFDAGSSILTNEHIVELTGLAPDTRYFYSVGSSAETFAGGVDCTFKTSPAPGQSHPTRIWVLGDAGTGDASARSVRDSYYNFAKDRPTDLWLMLGDNAYQNGTEEEFQNALFDMFPVTLRQSVLWPIISNHDVANSTNPPLTMPYFQIFSLPTNGIAGGVPSGTIKYYSFDYGDIHFVCLDSQTSLTDSNSPQYLWLEQDLSANHKNWLIATCGNPPYGRIGNDTDTMPRDVAVRTHLVPLLEAHGLDLYFAGDDHAYERSFLLDGHYGLAATLTNTMILDGSSGRPDDTGPYNKHVRGPVPHRGAVYLVNGSAGHLDTAGPGHPANYFTRVVLGSVVLDVDDSKLDVQFLTRDGVIEDHFQIIKDNYLPVAQNTNVLAAEDTLLPLRLPAFDPDGDSLSYRIVGVPTNGTIQFLDEVVTNGSSFSNLAALTYLPNTNFHGQDTIMFSANDGFVDSAPASLAITVSPVNDRPTAWPQGISTMEDTGLSMELLGSDVEDDILMFTFNAPSHGTLSGTPPHLLYTPAPNYFGPDSFTFAVHDNELSSVPVVVTIDVQAVNDAPVARATAFPSTPIAADNISASVILDGSSSFDIDNDPLRFYWSEQGTLLATGRIASVNLPVGPHSILLRVSDGQDEGRVTVQVQVANAGKGVEQIAAALDSSSLGERNKRPLQATLAAALDAFDRVSRQAGINQLEAFKSKVRAQVAPMDPTLADRLTRMAQQIIDVMTATLDKPHFHSLTQEANRAMRLRFTGAVATQYYLIQASTNLVDWETVGVSEGQADSMIEFNDLEAPRFSQRFYRVLRP